MKNLFINRDNVPAAPVDAAQDTRLREALGQAYAAESASDELRQRIAAMSVQDDQRRVMTASRCPRLLAQLAAFAVSGILIFLALAWPRITTAYTLYRMQRAILNAQSIHASTWRVASDGSGASVRDLQIMNNLWRIETPEPHTVLLYSNGTLLSGYGKRDPDTPVRQKLPSELEWVGGVSLRQSPLNAALYSLFSDLREVRSEYGLGGRRIITYSRRLNIYDRPHTWLSIDAQTGLPVSIEVEGQRKGAWRLSQLIAFEFNKKINFYKFVRP